jgi:hypothetical protein
MTAERNIEPGFVGGGLVSSKAITAANTASDGSGTIGTDIFLLYTYSKPYVRVINVAVTASVAATTSNATVIRLFNSSQHTNGDTTSSANTYLLSELFVPARTAAHSTNAIPSLILASRFRPAGYLLVTSHVAAATNTAWQITLLG